VTAWLKIAARSFVVAAVAGAAQLGAAQALGMFVWNALPAPGVWRRELTWLIFIFAASVLVGVAGGRRSVRAVRLAIAARRAQAAAEQHGGLVLHQAGLRASRKRAVASAKYLAVDTARGIAAGASRVGASVCASLGALVPLLLVLLPARATFAPTDLRVISLAAVIGTGVGAVVSVLSLLAAPVAANAGGWLAGGWIFGLASVGIALATGRPAATPRLAQLDAPGFIGTDEWWLGPNLMIGVAAFFGFAVAATARWVGAHRLAVALSGLAGPAIVCAGYLFVGPGGELVSGYVAALLAATAGLLASTATAVVRRGKPKTAGAAGALTAVPGAVVAHAALLGPVAAAAAPPRAIQAAPTPAAQASSSFRQPQYPASKPASQYLAATGAPAPQYSANAYPTNQYPSQPGWPQPAPAAAATGSVYLAPPRSAPVAPPPVKPPTPVPRAKPAPAAAPPVPPAPPPTVAKPVASPPSPPTPAPAPAVAPPKRGRTPRVAPPPDPSPAPAAKDSTPTVGTRTDAPTGKTPAAAAPKSKVKQRGRADKTVRVPPAVQPERVRSEQATEDPLPRTVRPAEVVAVKATKPSPAAEPAPPKGRRARRRAAKLAAIRAEEEARLAKQRERDAKAMDSREREHVEWLQRLSSLPDDPTLVTRKK
jgi:hypothetical protein